MINFLKRAISIRSIPAWNVLGLGDKLPVLNGCLVIVGLRCSYAVVQRLHLSCSRTEEQVENVFFL